MCQPNPSQRACMSVNLLSTVAFDRLREFCPRLSLLAMPGRGA
jgi:hypothetical protein